MKDSNLMSELKSCRTSPEGRVASFSNLLEDRWFECFQASLEADPSDDNQTVQMRSYAAIRRLSEALRDHTVPEAIMEIGSNFIGCEQIAIVTTQCDSQTGHCLWTIRSVGLSADQLGNLLSHSQQIIKEVPKGEIYIRDLTEPSHPILSSLNAAAFVPLWQNHITMGAIVFFGLLPQKSALDAVDMAILKLLAVYAGSCLFNCQAMDRGSLMRWVR